MAELGRRFMLRSNERGILVRVVDDTDVVFFPTFRRLLLLFTSDCAEASVRAKTLKIVRTMYFSIVFFIAVDGLKNHISCLFPAKI